MKPQTSRRVCCGFQGRQFAWLCIQAHSQAAVLLITQGIFCCFKTDLVLLAVYKALKTKQTQKQTRTAMINTSPEPHTASGHGLDMPVTPRSNG